MDATIRRFSIMLILTGGYMLCELIAGFWLGSLALTSNEPMQERSIVVNASLLGDRVHFEASFDLFIAGDKNVGEGVSVCVGDLPEAPFGELGIGEGLIVRLLTATEKLEVLYDGEPVLERSLPLSLVRVSEGVRVRVACAGEPGPEE